MPEPVSATAGAAAMVQHAAPAAARTSTSIPGGEGLGAAEGVARSFRDALARVARSEQVVDRAMRRVARGGDLDEGELLRVQTAVYRASREAELVAKAVDRVSDTVREITQIKV